jgi:tRNA nucleotidyltransferase (CCA-adding enzyme)
MRRLARDDGAVVDDDPDVLLARLEALPAAGPLLGALGDTPTDVFLVGGAVRDMMLGREPRELDLVVETELEPVIARVGGARRLHDRFATAKLTVDGAQYDLARARRETYAHPGALPSVSPASLDEDLRRRDFTVNAIALAIAGPRRGLLIAHGSAIADLRAELLRVLHDASFVDDPTRLLRLALYEARLGFSIEPHTLELAGAAVADGALMTVSGARIGAELRRLACECDPVRGLTALHELGIDRVLASSFGLADPALAQRALALLPEDGERATLVLATAGLDVPSPELWALLTRLGFEATQRDAIVAAAANAPGLADALRAAQRPSEIAAAVNRAGLETVALAGGLGAEPAARRWLETLRWVKLEINGNHLLDAGVTPGPAVGTGLRAALHAKLDGRATGRDAELAEALRAAQQTG